VAAVGDGSRWQLLAMVASGSSGWH